MSIQDCVDGGASHLGTRNGSIRPRDVSRATESTLASRSILRSLPCSPRLQTFFPTLVVTQSTHSSNIQASLVPPKPTALRRPQLHTACAIQSPSLVGLSSGLHRCFVAGLERTMLYICLFSYVSLTSFCLRRLLSIPYLPFRFRLYHQALPHHLPSPPLRSTSRNLQQFSNFFFLTPLFVVYDAAWPVAASIEFVSSLFPL